MLKKIIFSFIAASSTLVLLAQDRLSLEDAIARALTNNYGLTISKLESDIAATNNTWEAVGAYPTITGTAQYNFSKELIDSPKNTASALGASVDGGWTIFNGFRIRTSKRMNEYRYDLSKGSESVQIENCISDVTLNYYAYILENKLLAFQKTLYLISKDRYERDKQSVELGRLGTYELVQSESAYLTDYQSYISQERRVRMALNNLNLAMGVDVNMKWNISNEVNVPNKEYAIGQLFELMTRNNNTLKNQYINLKISEENIEYAKGDVLPKVDIKAGGRYNLNTSAGGNSFQPYAGLTLSTTIFAGNMKKRNIEIANIQSKIVDTSIEQMKRELSTKLMNEFDNYDYNRRLASLAEREMEISKLNLDLSLEKYNNGSISSFDFRFVQLAYQKSTYNHLQIIYSIIKANTELSRLVGSFIQ